MQALPQFFEVTRFGSPCIKLFSLLVVSLCLYSCSSGGSGTPPVIEQPGSSGDGSQGDGGGSEASLIVSITAPESGKTFPQADMIELVGEATDPQDGELSGDSLVWESDRDGGFGTGTSLFINELSSGGHNIKLTATASHGFSAADTIFVWITEPETEADKRKGETNPYAPVIQRLPVQRDDEVITIRGAAIDNSIEIGYIARPVATYSFGVPSSEPVEPAITATVPARIPIAADAGRISGESVEDMALVTKSSSGGNSYMLEILSLYEAGQHLMADYQFTLPIPDSQIVVHVADLDAFDDISDTTGPETQYYDEVILAYPEVSGNEFRATLKVLSFETAEFAEFREGPLTTAVSERTITTTQPMYPSSQLIVRSSDERISINSPLEPQFVVSYLNSQRQIAIDVFRYVHSRDNLEEPDPATDTRTLEHVLHQAISEPLSVETADADGWSLIVERSQRIGQVSQIGRPVLLPVWHQDGEIWQDAWILEGSSADTNSNVPGSLLDSPQSFAFASLTVAGPTVIDFDILPNSKLQVTSARTLNDEDRNTFGDCELIGLVVLADTNRGPIVQTLRAASSGEWGSASFETLFGPASTPPNWWPGYSDPLNPPDTTLLSNTTLVAGGLTSYRNGLWDERGNQTANSCSDTGLTPELGPMPSYYVAQPDIGELHAVTEVTSSNRGTYVSTGPLISNIGDQILMLTGDADGDAAYYSSDAICIDGMDPGDCRYIRVGDATLHYVIEKMESSNVILQQPPKHIDYLPALGGLTNISMNDGFYAEFAQTDTNSGSINRKIRTDWTLGENTKVGVGIPGAMNADLFSLSLDAEHQTVSENFNASTVTVSLQQTTRAIGDDVVWGKTQTIDFWRFPAQGGKSLDGNTDTRFAEDAFIEIAIPEKPVTLIGPGTTNEGYQPDHHIGNILSYPAFSGDVTDIGELFGFLGAYVPTNENGDRECKPLDGNASGCLARINDVLETVATVTAVLFASEDFIGGEFESIVNPVDVAEVLQVGGTSYSAELEFSEEVRRGTTVTNTDKINAEFNGKIPLKVPKIHVPVVVDQQLRASAVFENAEISENTLGSKTRIVLNIPGGLPTQRSYQIRPAFGFSVGGSLNLSYQVNTSGLTDSFWFDQYAAPDPALNLPFRIVRGDPGPRLTSNEFFLGTDSSRNRMKGFFVRAGADVDPLNPSATIGDVLTKAPLTGDPVQLEVRVWNLSVATPVENLIVEFSAQEYVNGAPTGDPISIGGSSVAYLPYRGQFEEDPSGHVQSVYVYWDTTGWGPLPGSALRRWAIYVTLDPADQIQDETHELFDRYDDPLISPTGEILDRELEKAQNNRGWLVVSIAPALDESQQKITQKIAASRVETPKRNIRMSAGRAHETDALRATLAGHADEFLFKPIDCVVGEAVEISIGLQADALLREHGTLRVFDGHPTAEGSTLLFSRQIQGISRTEASFETFYWRPEYASDEVLYASYTGGGTDEELLIPIPVKVR